MNHEGLLAYTKKTYDACLRTMEKKNQDYSSGEDPFANFRRSVTIGITPDKAIYSRFTDKCARMETYINRGKLSVQDESFADTISDAINYLAILKAWVEDNGAVAVEEKAGVTYEIPEQKPKRGRPRKHFIV